MFEAPALAVEKDRETKDEEQAAADDRASDNSIVMVCAAVGCWGYTDDRRDDSFECGGS